MLDPRLTPVLVLAALWSGAQASAQPLPPAPVASAERAAPRVEAPSGLPSGAPRSAGPLSLLVLTSNEVDPADRALRRVSLREEATHPDYYRRFGGGSLTAAALVNCDTRQFRLESFEMFSRNNLAGGVATQFGRRSSWQTPGADTVLGRAVALACSARPPASPPPARRPPTPSPPQPAPRPDRPAAGPWSGAAQVAAADTEAQAQAVRERLAREAAALMPGLRVEVVRATVGGRVYHRVLVEGFESRAAADGFCRAMAARRRDCFVRR